MQLSSCKKTTVLCIFLYTVFLTPFLLMADETTDVPSAGIAAPSANVSTFTGAAGYSYPIEVPPGRNGIVPNISLHYSSSAKNGILGMGWTLDLGSIQRDIKYGLNYTTNDFSISINGSTAELTPRSDWGTNCYGSVVEGIFTKYCYNPTTNGWTGYTKDGTKYFYGTTDASRQDNPQDTTKIFAWKLDRVEDGNGNYMTVTYTKDRGEIYPAQIDYTGNTAGLTPTNKVVFIREATDRTDTVTKYHAVFPVTTARRIKSIEVYGQNSTATGYALARKYELTYTYSAKSSNSLVTNITKYGADGVTALPPATFTYTDTPNGYTMGTVVPSTIVTPANNPSNTIYGDFNGDGKEDVAVVSIYTSTAKVSISNGDGQFTLHQNIPVSMDTYMLFTGSRCWAGDYNGDGKTDFACINVNGVTVLQPHASSIYMHLSQTNPDGTFAGFERQTWNGSFTVYLEAVQQANGDMWWFHRPLVMVGDFNGDGKTDILSLKSILDGETKAIMNLSIGSGFTTEEWNARAAYKFYKDGKVWLGDFNGDGKTDIATAPQGLYPFYADKIRINLSTGSSAQGFTVADWPAKFGGKGASLMHDDLKIGDFNGDGKTDILYDNGYADSNSMDNYSRIIVNESTGLGFVSLQQTSLQCMWNNNWGGQQVTGVVKIDTGDFNSDGKLDILAAHQTIPGQPCMKFSNGNNLTTFQPWTIFIGSSPQNVTSQARPLILKDFNGDGLPDMMIGSIPCSGVYCIGTYYTLNLTQGPPPDLLQTINTGIGGTTTIEYTPSSAYLNTNLPFILQTVSKITVNDGNGNISTTTYHYEGGLYSVVDRDFYGFDHVRQTDSRGSTVETWYKQRETTGIPVRYKGLIERQITKDASGNVYTDVVNSYNYTEPVSGVVFPFLAAKDEFIFDGAADFRHVRTEFAYDIWGNTTAKKVAEVINDQGATKDDKYEYTEYYYNTNNWILNKPKMSSVTDKTNTVKSQVRFAYDGQPIGSATPPVKGNLTAKDALLAGGINPTVTYGYNQYGNQISATDARGYTATVEYDSTSTYPVKTTNAKGFITKKTYDYRFGKVLTETALHRTSDTSPPTASTTYDTFGRPLAVYQPGESTPSAQYQYLDLGTVGSQKVLVTLPFNLWSETYFDGLGRKIVTKAPSNDPARDLLTITQYNQIGKVAAQSVPCSSNPGSFTCSDSAQLWTVFTYDALGRTVLTTFPDTSTASFIFNKGIITGIDANSHVKTTEKDIHGRLTKVIEYSGEYPNHTPYATTTYTYDTLGNLIELRDAKNNITSITYDTLGRKTWMRDPDMTPDVNNGLLNLSCRSFSSIELPLICGR